MGNEHRRDGRSGGASSSSSSSSVWEGHSELQQALEGLACAKGTSANRVKAVANAAFKYAKDYKRVVHDVEMFVWRADVEHRLAGLYAMDAIIRQSHTKHGSKDPFTKRFGIRMSDTINAVKKISHELQENVRHVFTEWQHRGFYTPREIEEAGGRSYSLNNAERRSPTGYDKPSHRHDQSPTHRETTPTASSGKLASLLSIIKKKKEQQEHAPLSHTASEYQDPSPRHGSRYNDRDERKSDSYDRRNHDDLYRAGREPSRRDDKRGLLGSVPGSAMESSRVRRAPDDQNNDYDDRGAKKARGSRWGPPKAPITSDNGRPAPINTDLPPRMNNGSQRSPQRRSDGYIDDAIRQSPPNNHGQYPSGRDDWNHRPDLHAGSGMLPRPSQDLRSPQSNRFYEPSPSGQVDHRYEENGYDQGMPPMGRLSNDRQSPHPPAHGGGNTPNGGDKIPGGSGEICRKFLAGRCGFGDRCWHVHDTNNSKSVPRPRVEMNEAKRKTVLCNNFPLGKCRFGDKCSFAHGKDDLDQAALNALRNGPPSDHNMYDTSANGSRWQSDMPMNGSNDFPPMATSMNSANAYDRHPQQQQSRAFGTPQAVYNEPQGDRGNIGAPSMSSYPNAPVPGGPNQYNTTTNHHQDYAPSYQGNQVSRQEVRGHGFYGRGGAVLVRNSNPPATGATPTQQQYPPPPPQRSNEFVPEVRDAAAENVALKQRTASEDDDDVVTAAPEFTLQYDDDD